MNGEAIASFGIEVKTQRGGLMGRLETHEKSISMLRECIANLEEALSPILRGVRPEDMNKSDAMIAGKSMDSPAYDLISRQSERLDELIAAIGNIHDRVDV